MQKKQRVEVSTTPKVATLLGAPDDVEVVDTKTGPVTLWDRLKAYYHTIFAVVTGLLVIVVEVAPALDPAMAFLPEDWRHKITFAVVLANAVVTKLKSNEVWREAPAPMAGGVTGQ